MQNSRRLGLVILLMLACIVTVLWLTHPKQQPRPASSGINVCTELRAELEGLACPGTIANDWGALSYYRDDDARLAQEPATPQRPRVVFMGDSITYRWPGLGPNGDFKDIEAVNRGIGNQLTTQMLLRFRQDVIDLHPRVVVILGGSNDLAHLLQPAVPTIESNLASMAELAGANGIQVVLSSLPPVSDYEVDADGKPVLYTATHSPRQIVEANEWMKKYAARKKFLWVDYYSSLADERGFFKKGFSVDGLHPNDKGYAIMEKLLNDAISTAMR